MRTYIHLYTHTYTYTHAHTHTYSLSLSLSLSHTHTHTHPHTLAHTHIQALDRFGSTALHYAAGGGHAQVVRLLVQMGADANACSSDLDTPLHCAAKSGTEASVRAMLELGAATEATNSRSNTAEVGGWVERWLGGCMVCVCSCVRVCSLA